MPTIDTAHLAHFTGSEYWYRHPLYKEILFTDGVKYVAEAGEAFWLLDAIVITNLVRRDIAREPFQVWTLDVKPDHSAFLVCDDGNGQTLYVQEIDYTDFPLETISLWLENSVLYLPSER